MTSNEHREFGYLRVAVAAPELRVGDPAFNAARTAEALSTLAEEGCELGSVSRTRLTGYTCGDLFYQTALREAAVAALSEVARSHARACAGGGRSRAAARNRWTIVQLRGVRCRRARAGRRAEKLLPATQEYYESGRVVLARRGVDDREVEFHGERVPVGAVLIFEIADRSHCRVGIEICEDLGDRRGPLRDRSCSRARPSSWNPSAGDELLGKAAYRRETREAAVGALPRGPTPTRARGHASPAPTWFSSGHGLLRRCGQMLAETRRFEFATHAAVADFDLERVTHERLCNSSFSAATAGGVRRVRLELREGRDPGALRRSVPARPSFPRKLANVPPTAAKFLRFRPPPWPRRVRHTGARRSCSASLVASIQTLAALVCVQALEKLGRKTTDLLLRGTAWPRQLGAHPEKRRRARGRARRDESHDFDFRSRGRAPARHRPRRGAHDNTFENAQARERTQILMDVANQAGGFVVGTGDLSETALGWCTYNADPHVRCIT